MKEISTKEFEEVDKRLRSAYERMNRAAEQIPPLSQEQIHSLIDGGRLSQSRLRRQADGYLLILSLLVLALAASILWHAAPEGFSPLKIVVVSIAMVAGWIALRAAYSLWLMWQTNRLRHHPYRMSYYADRLERFTRRRRWWTKLILRNSNVAIYNENYSRREIFALRIPSYSIAVCLLLLIGIDSGKALATTPEFVKVRTTTDLSADAICDTVGKIIRQL